MVNSRRVQTISEKTWFCGNRAFFLWNLIRSTISIFWVRCFDILIILAPPHLSCFVLILLRNLRKHEIFEILILKTHSKTSKSHFSLKIPLFSHLTLPMPLRFHTTLQLEPMHRYRRMPSPIPQPLLKFKLPDLHQHPRQLQLSMPTRILGSTIRPARTPARLQRHQRMRSSHKFKFCK